MWRHGRLVFPELAKGHGAVLKGAGGRGRSGITAGDGADIKSDCTTMARGSRSSQWTRMKYFMVHTERKVGVAL